MISRKHERFLDEYLIDLDPAAAYVRAGYSPNGARQAAHKLLHKPEIAEALKEKFEASRVSPEEVIQRLDAMARGQIPTKRVEGSHAREEFDTRAAAVDLGKVYALFHDKIELNISHLDIVEDEQAS